MAKSPNTSLRSCFMVYHAIDFVRHLIMRSIPFSPGLEFLRFLLEITSAGQNDQYLHITVDHLDFRDYLNPPEVGHGDIKHD